VTILKHGTEPDISTTAPVDSMRVASTFQIFGDALGAMLRAQNGSAAEIAARHFARRLANEIYLEDCRAARSRRDKWLSIIDGQVRGTSSRREGS
jgi:hypothetical protein